MHLSHSLHNIKKIQRKCMRKRKINQKITCERTNSSSGGRCYPAHPDACDFVHSIYWFHEKKTSEKRKNRIFFCSAFFATFVPFFSNRRLASSFSRTRTALRAMHAYCDSGSRTTRASESIASRPAVVTATMCRCPSMRAISM